MEHRIMENWKKLLVLVSVLVFASLGVSGSAYALSLWGNSAGSSLAIEEFDVDVAAGTASEVVEFNPGSGNGRGVVVVGGVLYYTETSDSNIYMLDAITGAALGSIATTQASMSTLAWDGSAFWTTDYSGTNEAYRIALDGTLLKTINLSLATGYSDGMEYFDGKLIANRTDGGFGGSIIYDIYDLDGNVLVANFISSLNGTGIAYDGTDFLVSDIYNSEINVYSGATGAFIKAISLPGVASNGGAGRLIEDLSVDYALRDDTQTIPEPASLFLFGSGLVGFVAFRRKFKV